jgi:hypothetical protein
MIVATSDCSHEAQLVETIAAGRWPHACDQALAAHACICPVCADVVAVATALQDAAASARQEARTRVPAAGLVWWRASVRARAEASRIAERPITVVQGVAGACAVGLAAGVVGAAWQSLEWFRRLGDVMLKLEPDRLQLAATSGLIFQHALPLVLGLGACLVIAPLALYLVLSDD